VKPRKTLRVARWELSRSVGSVDKRTAILGIFGLILVFGGGLAVFGGSVALDDDIYRVGIPQDSSYYDAVDEHSALKPVPPEDDLIERGDAEIVLEPYGPGGYELSQADTQKGDAAMGEFEAAIDGYNYRMMSAESNQTAAFPVLVDLRYEAGGTGGTVIDEDPADTTPDDAEETESDGDTGTDDGQERDPENGDTDDGRVDGDEAGDGDDTADSDDDPAPGDSSDTGNWISDAIAGDGVVDTPAGISPPFPFGSLVLAFLFIIPMNFVIQLYGSSIMNERINRRGELLLVAPVSRGDVIVGKTLPYLAALVVVSVAIALAIEGGPVSIAAVVPIALLFLASTFVGAMFARSFKELTFVTVTISVLLTSYVFVPAIFTDITPIALISPLTLVVWDLQGEAVSALQYTFSTGAFYLLSVLLFGLGAGVYCEEDMFSQRSIHLKVLDALANYVAGLKSVAAISALMIPFVFVAQLLAVTILFALPEAFALPVLLLWISCTEELAKSLHIYAGYAHNRFDRSIRTAVAVGAASGLGFFLAEKVTHVAQIVGITQLELGAAAFPTTEAVSPVLAVGLFFLPLALHVLTAVVSTIGARRDRVHYMAMLVLAISIHTLYNYVVIFHVQ